MGAKETGWFRLEGGAVQEMDLPLQESIQQRVDKGEIVRVVEVKTRGKEKRWVPWEPPPVEDAPEDPYITALRDDRDAALARVAELEAALDAVTKERDDLQAAAKK